MNLPLSLTHTQDQQMASVTTIIILTSVFLLISYLLIRPRKGNHGRHGSIPLPSPPKLPIIGNLHQLGKLPHLSLATLSQKYGPLMLLHYGSFPTLVASSTKMAEQIMKNHDLVFASRPRFVACDRLFYGSTDVAFSPYGSYWRQVKKICILQLLSVKKVLSFRLIREEEVSLLLDSLSHSCSEGSTVDLSDKFVYLTESILCRAAFGKTFPERDGKSKFRNLFNQLSLLLGSFCVGDFFPSFRWIDVLSGLEGSFKRTFQMIDAFLDEVIEEHVVGAEKVPDDVECKDLVDVLLEVQKDATLDVPLTKDHIKGLIADIFAGGIGTTAAALEWTMAELIKHPEKMRKAQAEVRALMAAKGKPCLVADEDVQKNLKYLNCAIKEALRLQPPIPLLVPRQLAQDTVVHGHFVPAGTRAIINAWAVGRDPQYWENPEEFKPERFETSNVDVRGQDLQLIPFGAGRRICPGISFAMYTVGFVLANLLYHFDWKVPGGGTQEELDMSESPGVTVGMKFPLKLVPTAPSLA